MDKISVDMIMEVIVTLKVLCQDLQSHYMTILKVAI